MNECGPRKLFLAGLCWAGSAAYLAVLLGAVWLYYMPFPWAEPYGIVPPLLEQWRHGTLGWSDFFITRNGMQIGVTTLLHVVLARLTGWNQAYEVGCILLLGAALYGLSLGAFAWGARRLGRPFPHTMALVMASLVFSLNQSCNWMWGIQILTFLSVSTSMAGLFLLTCGPPGAARLATAGVLGFLSTFSFGTGLLFWPSGLLALVFPAWWSKQPLRRGVVAYWCMLSVVSVALWRYSMVWDAAMEGSLPWSERLWIAARFLPIYLGAPLAKFRLDMAIFVGLAGIAVGVAALAGLRRRHTVPWEVVAPFAVWMFDAAAMGVAASLKRGAAEATLWTPSYGGLLEGAALRYPTMSQFYWIGLVGLGWLVWGTAPASAVKTRTGCFILWAAVAAGSTMSGRTGYYEAQERYRFYAPLVRSIVMERLEALPTRLQWPYGNESRESLRIMREQKLSFFQERAQAFWRSTGCRSNADWGAE